MDDEENLKRHFAEHKYILKRLRSKMLSCKEGHIIFAEAYFLYVEAKIMCPDAADGRFKS